MPTNDRIDTATAGPARPGRRSFLTAGAGVLTASAAGIAAPPKAAGATAPAIAGGADDALLAACNDFSAAQARWDVLNASQDDLPDAMKDELNDFWYCALERLTELRATSRAGVLAKVAAAHRALETTFNGLHPDEIGREEMAALAALSDVLAVFAPGVLS